MKLSGKRVKWRWIDVLTALLFIAGQGVLVGQVLFPSSVVEADGEGTRAAQAYWAVVAAFQIVGMLWLWRLQGEAAVRRRGVNDWRVGLVLPGLIVTVCFASWLWSVNPDVTARRSIALAANLMFAFAVIRARGVPYMEKAVWVSTAFPILVSVAAYAAGFDWARMENAYLGAGRGLYVQKNVYGMFAWIALLAGWHMLRSRQVGALLAWGSITCAIMSIAVSQSTTAVLAAALAASTYLALSTVPLFTVTGRAVALSVLCGSMASLVLFATCRDGASLAGMLGRDTTLTGRTDIWAYVADAISGRPLLGYGYGAFWRTDGFTQYFVARRFGYDVSHSHNAILDVAIDLGAPFATMVLVIASCSLLRIARNLLVARSNHSLAFWGALLVGLIVTSISEPICLIHNGLVTPLFWLAVLLVWQPSATRDCHGHA